VLSLGVALSLLSALLLERSLVSVFSRNTDADLMLVSSMGLTICEERFSDLLELRLEDDLEMNQVSRREAVAEIENLSGRLPGIHTLVVENSGGILGKSVDWRLEGFPVEALRGEEGIVHLRVAGVRTRAHSRYFPFWRWHIVSLVTEEEYLRPIRLARWVIYAGTFGVLFALAAALTILFRWRIGGPLRSLIDATRGVAEGDFSTVRVGRADEIGQVALAFNAMVHSLGEERKKTKAMMVELRDSEEQYRILAEYSPMCIVMLRKGRFVYANKTVLEALGYLSMEFLGMGIAEFIHPEDREMVLETLDAVARGEMEMQRFECRYLDRRGSEIWFENLAVLILYREKPAVIVHALNIGHRKEAERERLKLEERLQRAQKMEAIGTLAGGVAHDLNNILGGVVGYPDLLLMRLPEDSPLRRPLETIRQSGQRAAAIVQDMLTLARRGVSVSEVVDVNDIVRRHMEGPEQERLRSEHPEVRFTLRLEPGLSNILGSPVHLSKTLMNLLTNAAQSIEGEGEVVVSTCNRVLDDSLRGYETVEEGDYAVLSVSDNGTGMPAEDLPRVFEPFYTKKVMGRSGTGLGMAVVWGTVKDHRGFVDIQSAPGEGTRLDLYFPVTREEGKTEEAAFSLDELRGEEVVLVVDDVREQREIAERMLKELGYSVFTAAGGEEAVEFLKRNPADLVVLDMIMEPGMDGLDTYRKILEHRPGQKAVIVSGFSQTERVREARTLGARAYVKKPYVLERIGQAVRQELDRKD